MRGLIKANSQRKELTQASASQATGQSIAISRATLSAFVVSVLHIILTLPVSVPQ